MKSPSEKKDKKIEEIEEKMASSSSPSKEKCKKNISSKDVDVSNSFSRTISFVFLPLLVAILGGIWHAFGNEIVVHFNGTIKEQQQQQQRTLITNDSSSTTLGDKYASDLVHIQTQKFFPKSTKECTDDFSSQKNNPVDENFIHIKKVHFNELVSKNQVFFMLNGENEGLLFPFDNTNCLYELIVHASILLGMDVELISNGLKLMTQEGKPILSAKELESTGKRVAHILFDGQIWVWPGIEVGHTMLVDQKWKMTTHSLRPKVFSIEYFFNEQEAEEIMKDGINNLERSPVDSADAVDGYHSDRTSFTAFLEDSNLTRNFRKRTSQLARLPSASFVEKLQLVRYEKGQFFRKHEDYFDSKEFLTSSKENDGEKTIQEYKTWTKWASSKIDQFLLDQKNAQNNDQNNAQNNQLLSKEFDPKTGNLYPDFENKGIFQHELLKLFLQEAKKTNFFFDHAALEWEEWIETNLKIKADDIMTPLLQDKEFMLPYIIKAWEKKIGFKDFFQYNHLKEKQKTKIIHGMTHYFRWIRWAKEKIQDVLDDSTTNVLVPKEILPTGDEYPTYHQKFQNFLVNRMFNSFSYEEIEQKVGIEWAKWLKENQNAKDILLEAFKTTEIPDQLFDLIVEAWTILAGKDLFHYE
jgi:hypothetical protein